jgi:hypothetical protein
MANIKKRLPENVEGEFFVDSTCIDCDACRQLAPGTFAASREFCWYSWAEQTRSVARLRDFPFEWVLPGHRQRVRLAPDVMRRQVTSLVSEMAVAA